MSLSETLSVLQSIHESIKTDKPEGDIYTLGNGELVVILSDGTYIWNKRDWLQYRRGSLPALKVSA